MAKQFQHEWGFMANTSKGDLAQCQVSTCRKWRIDGGKPFTMSHDEFVGMHNRGEINADEVLGDRTNSFLEKPAAHKGFLDIN